MRVLVTGATGFLGQAVCRRLVRRRVAVCALVRRPNDALRAAGIDCRVGDLRHTTTLEGIARGCDAIVHAAAVFRGARISRRDFWQVNAEGTRRLLNEAVRAGVERFVYVSTAGVHGHVQGACAVETDPPKPADLYALTKLQGEAAVRRIARTDGLGTVILRPCAIYGPGDQRFLKLFRPIAKRRFALIGSGRLHTHCVHVADVAEAVDRCLTAPPAVGETFLVAGPAPTTIRAFVAAIARSLGAPEPRWRVPYAPVWVAAHLLQAAGRLFRFAPALYPRRLAFFGTNRAYSSEKLRTVLGWAPETQLDDGLLELARWYRDQGLLDKA